MSAILNSSLLHIYVLESVILICENGLFLLGDQCQERTLKKTVNTEWKTSLPIFLNLPLESCEPYDNENLLTV